jgi:hypothetical protein
MQDGGAAVIENGGAAVIENGGAAVIRQSSKFSQYFLFIF